MAGNVRAEEIAAQQGDLLFISAPNRADDFKDVEKVQRVKEFESHTFSSGDGGGVLLIPDEFKSITNRLGHLQTTGAFNVDHPEHEPVRLPAGTYEVRRVKSWEASPKGVWVLTID